MRVLFILVFIGVFQVSAAQRLSDAYWHEGKLVTDEGQTVTGKLKYDLELEVVQMDLSVALKTYSVRNILSFEFLDARYKQVRKFVVLPYSKNPNTDYETPTFFELLLEGKKITLLSREKLVAQTVVNNNPYSYNPYMTYSQVQYDFFFLTKSGKISYFRGSRNELLDKLGDNNDKLKKFIKDNKLRTDNKYDMAKIIEYYNTY